MEIELVQNWIQYPVLSFKTSQSVSSPTWKPPCSANMSNCLIYRGADKAVARPGRKQATATKSNYCKPLKKKNRKVVRPTRSPRQQTSASDENWRPFNRFFSRMGLRTYQHPCNFRCTSGKLFTNWNWRGADAYGRRGFRKAVRADDRMYRCRTTFAHSHSKVNSLLVFVLW